MPRGRRGQQTLGGSLQAVRTARRAAARALEALRTEIASVRARLEELVAEQKRFLADLFPTGGGIARGRGRPGRRAGRIERRAPLRRGPAKADRFFAKLPQRFNLDAVRKVAGRLAGVSLAQWARAKKIAKTAAGYVKTGAGSPKNSVQKVRASKKPVRKVAAKKRARKRRRVNKKPVEQKGTPSAVAAAKS